MICPQRLAVNVSMNISGTFARPMSGCHPNAEHGVVGPHSTCIVRFPSAQKVLSSREEDIVHLLLCSAVTQLQHFRKSCHFHLEQPVGSHMMFQEEMQVIVTNTHRVTCDMCVAGQLKTSRRRQATSQSNPSFHFINDSLKVSLRN